MEEGEGHQPVEDVQLSTDVAAFTDDVPLLSDLAVENGCPIHQGTVDCPCNSFVNDWTLADANLDPTSNPEEPDYSRFENWIPQYVWPDKPCDYCRSRKLMCYKQRGEPFCTPCSSLFRECSLNSQTLEATNYADRPVGTFLDTLHYVQEDVATEHGTFTGIKPLKSKSHSSCAAGPMRLDDALSGSKRNGIRFPRHAVKILRDWLEEHKENPYPTEEEKTQLEVSTQLSPTQIANWLANARRRRKVVERARPKLCQSPSLQPTTPAIAIPVATDKPWDELNPLERWKISPPENEPAPIENIVNAVANSAYADDAVSTSPSSYGRRGRNSSAGSSRSRFKALSTASHETISAQTSSLSASSAALSHGSSHDTHGSFGSFQSGLLGKKERRRKKRVAPPQRVGEIKRRIFQCTFCTDTFKSKYDWTRHEKSLHLSLEKWICCPQGPIITNDATGETRCAYCELSNPSEDHIETHNHRQCSEKGIDGRTFYRKDHLRQHLRLMHQCELWTAMESWRATVTNINSRCGFCAQRFSTWQERVDHLTAHFKAGARMIDWKGCRGLDPAIAAQVTNAMPPYLIGIEAVSPNPFSASHRASSCQVCTDHDACVVHDTENQPGTTRADDKLDAASPKTTCWEVLAIGLGRYAKQMAAKGIVMTDEMLQTQARLIVYGSDDAWNQTPADNAEWLDLFKKAAGLDYVPCELGGRGAAIPEDLETYSDLGLRIPFAVQLEAFSHRLGDACNSQVKNPSSIEKTPATQNTATSSAAEVEAASQAHLVRMLKLQDEMPREELHSNNNLSDARARALEALNRVEAPLHDDWLPGPHTAPPVAPQNRSSSSSSHLRRHKYQLAPDIAARYASVTGPWPDAGQMPPPVSTTLPQPPPLNIVDAQAALASFIDPSATDAMIDFLGGGQIDASASTIPHHQHDFLPPGPIVDDHVTSTVDLNTIDWTSMINAHGDDDFFTTDGMNLDLSNSTTLCHQNDGSGGGGGGGDGLSSSATKHNDEDSAFDDIFDLQMEG